MSNLSSGGKPHRLNALDFVLIILIVGAVAAAVVIIIRSNPNIISGGDKDIEYVIETDALPSQLTGCVSVGDVIYDADSNQVIGTVVAVNETPHKLTGYNTITGKPVYTEVAGRIDIAITVKATVWADGSSYKIDNYRIAIGKEVSFHSVSTALSGEITAIG